MNRFRTLLLVTVVACALPTFAHARKVLGKLGQTVKRAYIYASANTRSRPYYYTKAWEYLVINPAKSGTWYRVRLNNGRDGYILSEAVARLPWDVTDEKTQPKPAPKPNASTGTATEDPNSLLGFAVKYVGTPYKWGGTDINNGIDCSAFVKKVFGTVENVHLPRTAAEQALVGTPINRCEDLQPGDRLYFWDSKRGKIGHTGIYMGNGYFVHSSSGKGVNTDYLDTPRWRKILVAARR